MNDQAGLQAVLDAMRRHVDPIRDDQVEALQQRLVADRLRVLLVGEAKRGKSTLGNVLLGREVLPSGVVPVTAITTTVRAGAADVLDVTYLGGARERLPMEELAGLVTEVANLGNHRRVETVMVVLGPPADSDAADSGTANSGVADSDTWMWNPAGLGWLRSGIELVDTPGVGSVHEHNTGEAGRALATMDAAVFVLSADPPVSASELALLRRVRDLSVRTYVVLNKADRLGGKEREQVADFTRRAVTAATGVQPRLFVVSALEGLQARRDGSRERWAASGMTALVEAIRPAVEDWRAVQARSRPWTSANSCAGGWRP